MSAHREDGLAIDPGQPVRGRGFAKMLVRRMLRHGELRRRYASHDWVPYGARGVLAAVSELVAMDPDALEYRLHFRDAVRGLAFQVGVQMEVVSCPDEVIAADLGRLAEAGLIVLTPGGVRLGIDYQPPPREEAGADAPAPRPMSPRRMRSQGQNSRKAVEARKQKLLLEGPKSRRKSRAPAAAGELAGSAAPQHGAGAVAEPNRSAPHTQSEPKTEPNATQNTTQTEPTVGSALTHGGFALGSASRAQPLYLSTAAAAAEDKSLESAATAAAITAPAPRAVAVARAAEQRSQRDAVGTQTEPTVGPPATQTGTQAQPTEQPKPALVGAGELAQTLAAEMLRAVRLAAAHEAAAPGIMQGYLDEGRPAEQIRCAISTLPNRTTSVQSANVLRSIMDGRFPAPARGGGAQTSGFAATMAKPASAPIEDIAAALSNHPGFPEIGDPKDFSVGTRNTINRLLEKLDREDLASRHQTARYLFDDDRPAFLAVARRHPGLWKLIREEPPDPDAAAPMSERIGVE